MINLSKDGILATSIKPIVEPSINLNNGIRVE